MPGFMPGIHVFVTIHQEGMDGWDNPATTFFLHLSRGERSNRVSDPGEGILSIDGFDPLTPTLSPAGRGGALHPRQFNMNATRSPPQPRSVPPVFFATSATILAATASIS